MFDVWGFVEQITVMIIGIVVGSYIYTKLIMKQKVRSELKGLLSEVTNMLNKDGETKEKLREIVDTVMDRVKERSEEMVVELIRKVKEEFLPNSKVSIIDVMRRSSDKQK